MKSILYFLILSLSWAMAYAGDGGISIAAFANSDIAGLIAASMLCGTVYRIPLNYTGTLAASSSEKLIFQNIPQGHVVKGFLIKFGGTFVAADLAELSIRLGAKNILPVNVTGADFLDLCDWKGMTADATYMFIPFFDPKCHDEVQSRLGEIDTTIRIIGQERPYSEFTLTIRPDGTQSASPTISVEMVCDTRPKPQIPVSTGADPDFFDTTRLIRCWTYADVYCGNANSYNPITMNFGTDSRNNVCNSAIFTANGTKFQYSKDNVQYLSDEAVGFNTFWQKELQFRVPQSGLYVLDFTDGGQPFSSLDLQRPDGSAASFKWELYVTSAETVRVYNELLCPYERL